MNKEHQTGDFRMPQNQILSQRTYYSFSAFLLFGNHFLTWLLSFDLHIRILKTAYHFVPMSSLLAINDADLLLQHQLFFEINLPGLELSWKLMEVLPILQYVNKLNIANVIDRKEKKRQKGKEKGNSKFTCLWFGLITLHLLDFWKITLYLLMVWIKLICFAEIINWRHITINLTLFFTYCDITLWIELTLEEQQSQY